MSIWAACSKTSRRRRRPSHGVGVIGHVDWSIHQKMSDNYKRAWRIWHSRAVGNIHESLGCLRNTTIEHLWHGRKDDRGDRTRREILISNQFDPETDAKR